MPEETRSQQPKLLDEVRKVLRLRHDSIHTERSHVEWIVRFVRFHVMRSREDLFPAEPKIELDPIKIFRIIEEFFLEMIPIGGQ